MAPKLYLDENIPPLLAQQLRRRGFDVSSAHEVEMLGKSDEEQLKYATQNGRILLTFDTDFVSLAIRWLAEGKRHNGIVISSEYKIGQIDELVRLCSGFLSQIQPEDVTDITIYLQQFK
jgi:predicted nuclease of predicted toxin-antitoxin system